MVARARWPWDFISELRIVFDAYIKFMFVIFFKTNDRMNIH